MSILGSWSGMVEGFDEVDDERDVFLRQFVEHGQADETICKMVTAGKLRDGSLVMLLIVVTQMQTEIVEDGIDVVLTQVVYQCCTLLQ